MKIKIQVTVETYPCLIQTKRNGVLIEVFALDEGEYTLTDDVGAKYSTEDKENYTGILRPSKHQRYNTENTHEFIVFHDGHDLAYFYIHYDLKNDTVYVTSEGIATQAITIAEIVDVLKATIGINN